MTVSTTASAELDDDWLERGLSAADVDERIDSGRLNTVAAPAGQSWLGILRRNTLTWLNLLLGILGIATVATGSLPDATFLAVAIINSAVGTGQELRAKRTLDALAVVSQPQVRVVRNGRVEDINIEEIVIDDLVELRTGDQIPADAVAVADAAEVDESLITGESNAVSKVPGDRLTSGSWVTAGVVRARVTAVGVDSYAARLAASARQFSLTGSELMGSINRILRWVSLILIVVGPVLVISQLRLQSWRPAIRSAVAGLVGMIPEGLVLLTTIAFLTAVTRLGRRRVLIQELPAVEGLARVDSLCVDKTGTITQGLVGWNGLVVDELAPFDETQIRQALAALASARDANQTLLAIRAALPPAADWQVEGRVPFDSARKWSAASFTGHGTWVLGAPEMILGTDPDGLREQARAGAATGLRVLVLAQGTAPLVDDSLPADLRLVALVELREELRPDAPATLGYFAAQGVTVRVISGDSAATVGAVASAVGLQGAEHAIDARTLSDDVVLAEAVEADRVFGRVTPEQKRQMVVALHQRSHVVAMTGDGVNDVLALKEADLGIAMGSGAPVTRGVAQLVLLDDQFEALPEVVAEGRQVLANIERVASLFLVKNVYSLIISVVVPLAGWPYPFLPRHLTLINTIAIGTPAFFLALAPNQSRFESGFLRRVLTFSIPAGAICALATLLTFAIARAEHAPPDNAKTAAVSVTMIISLWIVVIVARPLKAWKVALVMAMAGLFAGTYLTPGLDSFFSLSQKPGPEVSLSALVLAALAAAAIDGVTRMLSGHNAPRPSSAHADSSTSPPSS